MTVSGVEGPDPLRGSTAASATTAAASTVPQVAAPPSAVPAAARASGTPHRAPGEGFANPELTSGLLSDNITPVQREGLGRLSRLLRLQPRDLLDMLRNGTGLGMLLAARRLGAKSLVGMFDKGLLIDAEA